MKSAFSVIKSAISEFKKGKFVIVIDDKNRENEADLIVAAEKISPEKINFMIREARGLVCVPMLGKRLDVLKLPLMTETNTEFMRTAFTIPVDAKKGTTTGISAFDRAATIKALINKTTRPSDLARPGHVFPLRCDENGLGKRPGHTEASIELCKLAGFYPAAVICEIVGKNGKMARMPEIKQMGKKHGLKVVKMRDLIEYSKQAKSL